MSDDGQMGSLASQDDYDPFAAEKFVNPAVGPAIGNLLSLPQRAIENSQNALDTGNYNPAPVLEAATLPMGTGAIAGVPVKGAEAVLGAGPIRAYHSSPHDFDAFDLSKIGTGEGAQAYGHGLYFAENPAVSGQGGQYWDQFLQRFEGTPEAAAAQRLKEAGFDRTKAIDLAQRDFENARSGSTLPYYQELKVLKGDKPVGPRTYEVNINADPAHFLDYDKALSQQPHAQTAVEPLLKEYGLAPSNYLGSGLHDEMVKHLQSYRMSKPAAQEAVSIDMRSAGIPGIKYLDQGSRGVQVPAVARTNTVFGDVPMLDTIPSPKQTHNYVVFNPAIVDIMKKYGLAGAAPLGALAAQDSYGDAR